MGVKVIERETRVIGRFGKLSLLYFAVLIALSGWLVGVYAPTFNNISTGFIVSGLALIICFQWTDV